MPEDAAVEQPEVVTPPTETAAASEAAQLETEEKKKGGFQRRIDRLTAEKYQERDARLRAEGELKAYREKETTAATKPAQAETAEADPEPKQDDFATYELWIKAQTRWEARQVAREEYQKLSAKQEEDYEAAELEERAREVVDSYQDRTRKYRETNNIDIDDYNDVTSSLKMRERVGQAVQNAILEDENGPMLAYYLGQHPEVVKKLDALTPESAVKYLGRIAERLAPETAESTEEKEEPPSPKPKPEVKAPAPITPVRKSSPTSTGLSDDLSPEEWLKRRNAQLAAAGRK